MFGKKVNKGKLAAAAAITGAVLGGVALAANAGKVKKGLKKAKTLLPKTKKKAASTIAKAKKTVKTVKKAVKVAKKVKKAIR